MGDDLNRDLWTKRKSRADEMSDYIDAAINSRELKSQAQNRSKLAYTSLDKPHQTFGNFHKARASDTLESVITELNSKQRNNVRYVGE